MTGVDGAVAVRGIALAGALAEAGAAPAPGGALDSGTSAGATPAAEAETPPRKKAGVRRSTTAT
eukprot:9621457-Alexandrium_andersonii.AAC.1